MQGSNQEMKRWIPECPNIESQTTLEFLFRVHVRRIVKCKGQMQTVIKTLPGTLVYIFGQLDDEGGEVVFQVSRTLLGHCLE